MVVPEVDIDRIRFRRFGAPEFARREADAVAVLRRLAPVVRVGVREDEDAVVAVDRAGPAADVARDAGVAGRVDIARDHTLAHFETGRAVAALGRAAAPDDLDRKSTRLH